MESLQYSFIIPVYNRPEEIEELLESFTMLKGDVVFEIIVVEDGSTINCKSVVESYQSKLNIAYYFKQNLGPGDSRNFGMQRANGNYFIILDSDCLLPENYLVIVNEYLKHQYVDCYGGPDTAHDSFSNLQKAINFTMTSFITTGGIRGGKKNQENFQPRSFNMGISKEAFEVSKGFGTMHPGEDPDLAIRLRKLGFKTVLISNAFVYHKRRISWSKFLKQVYKFGMVRPILNLWHPNTNKIVYWLPSLFITGFILAILLFIFGFNMLLIIYGSYLLLAFILALVSTKNLVVAIQSMIAILVQFIGYGFGFIKATIMLKLSNKSPEEQFPYLFFKNVK